MPPLFTILLPVVRPPVLLPFAIETVLAQSVGEFELFVLCDGAPPDTVACAEGYACRDARVKVFRFPKGERHGEAYRHALLADAGGRYVAHICDDDLWLPNHLEEMAILLSAADFGNLLHVFVRPDGRLEILAGDIGSAETRRRMLEEKFNLFGLTFGGYRMEAYRRLPEGWAPAPTDIWTDLHMWRKFLRFEGFAFATRAAVTAIHFATPDRLDVSLEQRQEENRLYLQRVRDPSARNEIVQAAWRSLLERTLQSEQQAIALAASRNYLAAELARTATTLAAKDASSAATNFPQKMPAITAIIPVFNGGKYLSAAIDSVLAQTLLPIELILVDDGSVDGCCDDLDPYRLRANAIPIRLIRRKNAGQSAARNAAAALATGEYLAFLDQDDIWYPFHLQVLVESFERHPELGWAYSDVDEIDAQGMLVTRCFVAGLAPHPKTRLADLLGADMFVVPTATIVSKYAFDSIGGFDERLLGYEDDDLFLRLFRKGFGNLFVPRATAQWRLHGANVSSTKLMVESRRIYARKLTELYPDDRLRGRFYVRELIAPRFLRSAVAGYARALSDGDTEACRWHRDEARFVAALCRKKLRYRCAVVVMYWPWLFRRLLRLFYPEHAWRAGL